MHRKNGEVATSQHRYNWWPIYVVLTMNVAVVLGWMLMQGEVPATSPGDPTEASSLR